MSKIRIPGGYLDPSGGRAGTFKGKVGGESVSAAVTDRNPAGEIRLHKDGAPKTPGTPTTPLSSEKTSSVTGGPSTTGGAEATGSTPSDVIAPSTPATTTGGTSTTGGSATRPSTTTGGAATTGGTTAVPTAVTGGTSTTGGAATTGTVPTSVTGGTSTTGGAAATPSAITGGSATRPSTTTGGAATTGGTTAVPTAVTGSTSTTGGAAATPSATTGGSATRPSTTTGGAATTGTVPTSVTGGTSTTGGAAATPSATTGGSATRPSTTTGGAATTGGTTAVPTAVTGGTSTTGGAATTGTVPTSVTGGTSTTGGAAATPSAITGGSATRPSTTTGGAAATPSAITGGSATIPGPISPDLMTFKIDLAVTELSPQERDEIIRERMRLQDEERERSANARGFFARIGYRFTKEYRKAHDLTELRRLSDSELFATSSEDFKNRKTQRAEEIAQLSANTLFNEISSSKGFERFLAGSVEGSSKITSDDVRTNSVDFQNFLTANPDVTRANAEAWILNRDLLITQMKDFAKDIAESKRTGNPPRLSRDAFERTKATLLKEMTKFNPELATVIESEFDNTWFKVEQLAQRVEGLSNAADVLDAMNIDLNVKFGRARLNHETQDRRTISSRLEDAVVNSRFLSFLPFEKRYYVHAGLATAVNLGAGALRGTVGRVPFLGALVSGLGSAGLEYVRKRDEVIYEEGRVTRLLAEGKDVSELMGRNNPREIARNVSIQKTDDILRRINQQFDAYNAATVKDASIPTLIEEIAAYRSLLEMSNQQGVDFVGSSSAEQLIKDKAQIATRCNEILELLQKEHPTVDLKNMYVEASRKRTEDSTRLFDEKQRQAASLRNGMAFRSAATVGLITAAGTIVGREVASAFSPSSQNLGEYLLGRDQEAASQTSLAWLAKTLRGDTQALHEVIRTPDQYTHFMEMQKVWNPDLVAGVESAKETVTLSGEDALKELRGHSTFVEDLQRTYTGDWHMQEAKYGGLTRSMWESDKSSTLNIFGRDELGSTIGEKTVLHDFDAGYLDAFKNGSLRAIVNLPGGETVDVSHLLKLENGVIKLPLADEGGVIGAAFKNGSAEGLNYVENIQYGIGKGSAIDIVSTIDGKGMEFIPDPITKVDEVSKEIFGKYVDTLVSRTEVIEGTQTLGAEKSIDDLYYFYFGSLRGPEKEGSRASTTPATSTTVPAATTTVASSVAVPSAVTAPAAATAVPAAVTGPTTPEALQEQELIDAIDAFLEALRNSSDVAIAATKFDILLGGIDAFTLISDSTKNNLKSVLNYHKTALSTGDLLTNKKETEKDLLAALGPLASRVTETITPPARPSATEIEDAKNIFRGISIEKLTEFFNAVNALNSAATFKDEVKAIKKLSSLIEESKRPAAAPVPAAVTSPASPELARQESQLVDSFNSLFRELKSGTITLDQAKSKISEAKTNISGLDKIDSATLDKLSRTLSYLEIDLRGVTPRDRKRVEINLRRYLGSYDSRVTETI